MYLVLPQLDMPWLIDVHGWPTLFLREMNEGVIDWGKGRERQCEKRRDEYKRKKEKHKQQQWKQTWLSFLLSLLHLEYGGGLSTACVTSNINTQGK